MSTGGGGGGDGEDGGNQFQLEDAEVRLANGHCDEHQSPRPSPGPLGVAQRAQKLFSSMLADPQVWGFGTEAVEQLSSNSRDSISIAKAY